MAIFKVFRPLEWQTFEQSRVFKGSADDIRDGFIHFSADHQLRGTLAKYYQDEARIIIAWVDNPAWGEQLKWDVSRGGAKFPHLYCDLHMDDVKHHWALSKMPSEAWDLSIIEPICKISFAP